MRHYLLVLDMDLLAVDEEFDLEPLNYFVAQQEREPCEVTVLSLVNTSSARLPAMELLLGVRVGKFPVAPRPEHRMALAIRHLRAVGCRADGLISDEDDLVKVVRSETRGHDYASVVLGIGRSRGSALGRRLHLDPVHRLRRQLGPRLVMFPLGPGAPHPRLSL